LADGGGIFLFDSALSFLVPDVGGQTLNEGYGDFEANMFRVLECGKRSAGRYHRVCLLSGVKESGVPFWHLPVIRERCG
jgi:hypothetical protein